MNPYDRGHEVPCEKADIHIYFGDLFRDEGETSQAALELVNEYGSGWYLATRMCPGEYEITLCDNDDKTVWTLNPYVEYNEEGTYFSFTQGATSVIGKIDEDDDTILDIDEPSKVLYRCENYLLTPEEPYEERGFVPNVTFPCATLQDTETGRIAIYYGAADTYVGLAFTQVDLVVDYIKKHSVVTETDLEVGRR